MKSRIEWTECTWNPVTGCTKISPGCLNCYAEIFAERLKSIGAPRYRLGFQISIHADVLKLPLQWKKSRAIFVNSMSDIFHEDVPDYFIRDIFKVMNQCPHHTFQVLTKRSKRMAALSKELHWTQNIWMGVSIENSEMTFRIRDLLRTHAQVKFLSCEPLLGPIPNLLLDGIQWVIVGGESGRKARPIKKDWVVAIRDRCLKYGIPYFFKQWGGMNKKASGRILDGRTWDDKPPLAHKPFETQLPLSMQINSQ